MKRISLSCGKASIALLTLSLTLNACATKPKVAQIEYDNLDFDSAIYQG